MKNNQKGFSIAEGLVVIVLVGLVASVGWYVWQQQQSDDDTTITEQSAELDTSIPRGYKVTEANVDIVKLSDFEKLPAETPKDFVVALKAKFNIDNSDSDQECTTVFTVEKVSEINIKASKGWAEIKDGKMVKDSMVCGGGVYSIWSFQDGKWLEVLMGNSEIYCKQLDSPKIYSEFIDKCVGPNQNGALGEMQVNPNGSIANAPRYE